MVKTLTKSVYDDYRLMDRIFFFFYSIVCLTIYFVFSTAVLPRSPGVVYNHLLLRRETKIPRVAFFSFRIGIWDLFLCIGDQNHIYTYSLWEVVDHSRSTMHYTCLIIIHDPDLRPGPESNQGPLDKRMSALPCIELTL